jgi:hypothetical protein
MPADVQHADSPQAKPAMRPARSWVMLLVGCVFAVLSAISLWGAIDTTLHGIAMPAKVIATEGGIGGKHSVHAKVEIIASDRRRLLTEVDDSLGLGKWVEGGTIGVVCTRLATRSPHCDLDSVLDRWLLPVLFFVVGCGAIWLALRKART